MAYLAIDDHSTPALLLAHGQANGQRVTGQCGLPKFEALAEIDGAPSRQFMGETRRYPTCQQHAVSDSVIKPRCARKLRIGMQRIMITTGVGKRVDVFSQQGARYFALLAFAKLVVTKTSFSVQCEASFFSLISLITPCMDLLPAVTRVPRDRDLWRGLCA